MISRRVITPRSRVRHRETGCIGTVTEICDEPVCWVMLDGAEEDEPIGLDLLDVLDDKAD